MTTYKKLNEKQLAAIEYLAQPKRGGLTHEEIADRIGVSVRQLYRWKNEREFQSALQHTIVRATTDRLPEVFEAMIDHIITDGNAAAFRTLAQMHGLLTDKVAVEYTEDKRATADDMRAEIERLRGR